jgi:hypothetical protein
MEPVESHLGKLETQLRTWGARLDEMVARAEAARTQPSGDYRKRLDEVKAKYKVAEMRFGELRKAGSGKWETFQAHMADPEEQSILSQALTCSSTFARPSSPL